MQYLASKINDFLQTSIDKTDSSLLSILASIMVFATLVNNLYKTQIIDEIRAWGSKIKEDFVFRFETLVFCKNKEAGMNILKRAENILSEALLFNQRYNIFVAIYWIILLLSWIFKSEILLIRYTLLVGYSFFMGQPQRLWNRLNF